MSRFLQALASRPLVMDGAMGTQLQLRGLGGGDGGDSWNLTRPDDVLAVHRAYAAAGAEGLLTNTFQANPVALVRHGRLADLDAICRAGVGLARSAAEGRFVIADVGPIITGNGEEFADLDLLRQTVRSLTEADALLLETCSSPRALDAAAHLNAWPETSHLPILLSLTYRCHSDGRVTTLSGHEPEWFALRARDHGVSVLGVNCGRDVGLPQVVHILKRYREATDLPLLARPNAGTPTLVDGRWAYPLTPRQFADRVFDLVTAGAALIGGCCGTTPDHIAACRAGAATAIMRPMPPAFGKGRP